MITLVAEGKSVQMERVGLLSLSSIYIYQSKKNQLCLGDGWWPFCFWVWKYLYIAGCFPSDNPTFWVVSAGYHTSTGQVVMHIRFSAELLFIGRKRPDMTRAVAISFQSWFTRWLARDSMSGTLLWLYCMEAMLQVNALSDAPAVSHFVYVRKAVTTKWNFVVEELRPVKNVVIRM